jgi:DNA-binding protein H-NS
MHSESAMRRLDLEAMGFDELWLIHEQITTILSEKIVVEKRELEMRLAKLNHAERIGGENPRMSKTDRASRRKYPKVMPKYCNPLAPSETWSGRGKQPRWLVAALSAGRKLEEFKISLLNKDPAKHRTSETQRG